MSQKYVLKILPLCEYDINLRIQFVRKLLWCKSKFTYTKFGRADRFDGGMFLYFGDGTLVLSPVLQSFIIFRNGDGSSVDWERKENDNSERRRFLAALIFSILFGKSSKRDVNFRRSQKMPLYISHIHLSQSRQMCTLP